MKKIIVGIAAAAAFVLGYSGTALAAGYTGCTVTDVQYVKVGANDYFVFKACSFFWYAPTSANGSRHVASLVTAAELANRQINVQCGINGGTCATVATSTYEGNTHAARTVWSAETVKIAEQ